ncbi:low-complexity protein [Thiomicrorhabdus sp. 6S2-11]|uniref:Low-complexity protein n=1 Tax=Thiomicrorhabdus marina TaxID=2818442 RepID=A0ABS3Q209_9GAMM|nr:low-complexity protein [Thiomicrorhabdus marina]MBO1926138.1 low-complexity protein [Thiomicrorhabdus marina]
MKTKMTFYSIIAAMLLSVSMNASAATGNPFATIQNGFTVLAQSDTPEGKCGTAKCGSEKPTSDAKCGAAKPADSKCGSAKPADSKCGAAKCGASK